MDKVGSCWSPPRTLLAYLLNDAIAKEDFVRANQLAKLSDNPELMKQLAKFYFDTKQMGTILNTQTDAYEYVGSERSKNVRLLLVDLAAHYFSRFGKIIMPQTNMIDVLYVSNDDREFLVIEDQWEAVDALTRMGVENKEMVKPLSRWGFYDAALTLAENDPTLKAIIWREKSYRAEKFEKNVSKARAALKSSLPFFKQALEEAKKSGASGDINAATWDVRRTLIDAEEWDEALKYADDPVEVGLIYEQMGNDEQALSVYQSGGQDSRAAQILSRQGKHQEALNLYLKDIEDDDNSHFSDNSTEKFQKRIKDRYAQKFDLDLKAIPKDQREAAKIKICASARKKAAEMGIDVSILVPNCKTE